MSKNIQKNITHNTKENISSTIMDQFVRKAIFMLLGLASFAAVLLFVVYTFIGSPKGYLLEKQNKAYATQLSELNQQIEQLNNKLLSIEKRDDNEYRPLYNLEPVSTDKRNAGVGGSNPYASLEGYQNSGEIIASRTLLDQLGRKLYVQISSFNEIEKAEKQKQDMLASIPAIQPVSVHDLLYISSYFGFRNHPKLHRRIKHQGLDFAASKGSPIYATGNGVVKHLTTPMTHYGKVVVIEHGYGYETLYAHMSKKAVHEGDTVRRGQVIGYVGGTGRVTGVHLHYEVLKNGRSINPRGFYQEDLNEEDYDRMISALNR